MEKQPSKKSVAQELPNTWDSWYVLGSNFVKKYSFASMVTATIMVLIFCAVVIRVSQKSSLGRLLDTSTTTNQDYDSLTSSNASSAATRGDTSADKNIPSTTPAGSAGSTTFTTTPTTPGGGSGSGGGGGGGNTVPIFAASITSFNQTGTELECGPGKPSKQKCNKRYSFEAKVASQNGPGTVRYGWRSNLGGTNEDGSYTAGNGSSNRTLQKSVTIACQSPIIYTMQFIITAPNQVSSSVRTVNHNCDEL